MTALAGEIQEQRDGTWRTVRLGGVRVDDRRRVDPLGLTPQQRAASDRAQQMSDRLGYHGLKLTRWQQAFLDQFLDLA